MKTLFHCIRDILTFLIRRIFILQKNEIKSRNFFERYTNNKKQLFENDNHEKNSISLGNIFPSFQSLFISNKIT